MLRATIGALAVISCLSYTARVKGEEATRISAATREETGVLVHTVESPYEAGTTKIRVLLPTAFKKDVRYPVVYVLPVEAGEEHHYGDGLTEVLRQDLNKTHEAIFVAPTFSHLPWYADHPTDPAIQQERYFLEVVVPFIEKEYPAQASREGRLLLGFSKSGWGAWVLLLRHPERFEKAAAWDAPLMMDAPGRYGSGPIFGTPANFAKYHVAKLLEERAEDLKGRERLIVLGYENFREEGARVHALLEKLKVPHHYEDGPKRKHVWQSGWVPEATGLLLGR